MLTPEQLAMIPSSTRSRWDGYKHDDYFGFEMVKDYIDSFDYIQQVLVSKHIKQGLNFPKLKDVEGNEIEDAETCDWVTLSGKRGAELESFYSQLLRTLSTEQGMLGQIYTKRQNKIQDPSKSSGAHTLFGPQ